MGKLLAILALLMALLAGCTAPQQRAAAAIGIITTDVLITGNYQRAIDILDVMSEARGSHE